MREPTVTEVAYAAGFFDGEGYVTINPQSRNHEHYYLRAGIGNTCPIPLKQFQDIWGGSFFPTPNSCARLLSYVWYLHGDKAASFLNDIEPYLQVKVGPVALAKQFQSVKGSYGSRYLNTEKEAHRIMAKELKALNRDPSWSQVVLDV